MTRPSFCSTDSTQALQAIKDCGGTLVLDFDYNLYLGNSTEDFLGTLRPAWLAYALINVIAFSVRVFGPFWGISVAIWRDYLWAYATWLLFPWSLLRWPRQARGLASRKFNQKMVDAIQTSEAERIIVISFGYEHVQRALLQALPFDVELIASKVGFSSRNLRVATKRRALLAVTSRDELADAVFVTDSKDDIDLLELIDHSYCVPWTRTAPFPFANVYVPFRYTAQGKYAVPDILWNQQFTEDFMVLLLAYAASASTLLALPLLFVSFFCVYEMGYYENNTLAVSKEENPTLSADHTAFGAYRIYLRGTIWAVATGVLGCLVLGVDEKSVVHWGMILLVTRGIFHLFNRLQPRDRIFVFPFLQIAKTFSFAPVLGLGPAGALLLFSQVMRQTTNYMIYRNEGNTRVFRRQAHRLLIFVMGTVVLVLAGHTAILHDWRYFVCLAWCVYRVLREHYGHGLRPVRVVLRKTRMRS